MDQVQLRYDIFEVLDEWESREEFQPDTIEELKDIIMHMSGNKLLVLYYMFTANYSQKEIAESVRISPAAVSKILKQDKDISRIRAILLFTSDNRDKEIAQYDEKTARAERSGKARYSRKSSIMSPSEIALSAALANDAIYEDKGDDYSDGNTPPSQQNSGGPQRGSISKPGGFKYYSNDPGETNARYDTSKHSETLQREALDRYWAELRKSGES